MVIFHVKHAPLRRAAIGTKVYNVNEDHQNQTVTYDPVQTSS